MKERLLLLLFAVLVLAGLALAFADAAGVKF